MSESNGDKLPVGIVNTVINKISDFTKEMEVLRAQLPSKESTNNKIDSLDRKMEKTLSAIKLIFTLAMIVVSLSFFGAKIIDWQENKTNRASSAVIDQKFNNELTNTIEQLLDERDIIRDNKRDEAFKQILVRIEALHKNDNKNEETKPH